MWLMVLVILVIILVVLRELQHQRLGEVEEREVLKSLKGDKKHRSYRRKLKNNLIIGWVLSLITLGIGFYLVLNYGIEEDFVYYPFLITVGVLYITSIVSYVLTKNYYIEVIKDKRENEDTYFSRVMYR